MQLGLAAWHRYVLNNDMDLLDELIAQDAVFHSPVVHTPQRGREKVMLYLGAAARVFAGASFTYVREMVDGSEVCLEFTAMIAGTEIDGVDLIRFDLEGRIVDFKVMVRPLRAIDVLWEKMAAELENT